MRYILDAVSKVGLGNVYAGRSLASSRVYIDPQSFFLNRSGVVCLNFFWSLKLSLPSRNKLLAVQHSSLNLLLYKMVKKRVLCGYGVDIDAVAGWLGSYGGEDSTSDISRGIDAIVAIFMVPRVANSTSQACLRVQLAFGGC